MFYKFYMDFPGNATHFPVEVGVRGGNAPFDPGGSEPIHPMDMRGRNISRDPDPQRLHVYATPAGVPIPSAIIPPFLSLRAAGRFPAVGFYPPP